MRTILTLLLALAPAPLLAAGAADYPRGELLIHAHELRARLDEQPDELRLLSQDEVRANPPRVLLDVRPQAAYERGTIGQAARVDVGQWKAAFGDGQDAPAWAERLGAVLPSAESTVIVFDEGVTPDAARAWWILKYWGIDDVTVLNGGMKAWREAGGALTAPQLRDMIGRIDVEAQTQRLATAEEVKSIINGSGATLLDSRTTDEHAAGYIPTACHTDWQEFVNADTGELRGPAELERLLARAEFDRNQRTVAYCQSGGRASVVAFATEVMGGTNVANYFGSWGEWSRLPDAPVARREP